MGQSRQKTHVKAVESPQLEPLISKINGFTYTKIPVIPTEF